jgi:hypothetical protein
MTFGNAIVSARSTAPICPDTAPLGIRPIVCWNETVRLPPALPMQTPEEKLKLIEEQVVAKVQWNTPDEDVLEWLASKHAIAGDDAQRMLKRAKSSKVRGDRTQAGKTVLLTAIGLTLAITYVSISTWSATLNLRTIVLVISLIAIPLLLIALIKGVLELTKD